MSQSIEVKVNGIVATNPLEFLTTKGTLFAKFRLASTPRFKVNGEWKNGKTQWFTIKAWGKNAENILSSVKKGNKLLVFGRLQVEEWKKDDKSSYEVCIHASSIGQDVAFGNNTNYSQEVYENPQANNDFNQLEEKDDYKNQLANIDVEAFTQNSKIQTYDETVSLC